MYENKGDEEEVVKHIEGFKGLLDCQKDNGVISEFAYNTLVFQTNNLLEKWG